MDEAAWASCMCPLCGLYRNGKATIERWDSRRRAKYAEKLQAHKDEASAMLEQLRAKGAAQLCAFDAQADLEAQYAADVRAVDAELQAAIARIVDECAAEYTDRMRSLGIEEEPCPQGPGSDSPTESESAGVEVVVENEQLHVRRVRV